MDRNAGDFAPKGEIPTEAEFARLFCDKTFVDYFNAFLSLPVFPQRLLYKFASQNLQLDPPLQRTQYRLDRVKLMRWVRTHRAPYFFKSDLYLEYVLCKQLQKTQLQLSFMYEHEKSSAKDKILDRQLISRWLGRISGMRRFRRFMSKTAGHRSLQFWMDAERIKRFGEEHKEDRLNQLRDMETKYLMKGNTNGSTSGNFDWRAQIIGYVEDDKVKGRLSGNIQFQPIQSAVVKVLDTETEILEKIFIVQGFLLRNLQNYWIPRFLIHCKLRFNKRSHQTNLLVYRPNFYIIEVQSMSELNSCVEDEQQTGTSNRTLATKNLVLKRQSVSNLLSMFSSSTARHSGVSALINLEDTGETFTPEKENASDDPLLDHREWLAEEFPLPDISEESLASGSPSPSRSTRPRDYISPLPVEQIPSTPSPDFDRKASGLEVPTTTDASLLSIGQREVSQKKLSLVKIKDSALSTAISEHDQGEDQHILAKLIDTAPLKDEEQKEDVVSPTEMKAFQKDQVLQDEPQMKREVDDADAQAPRCPSATPFQRSSIDTPSSLTVSKSSLSNSSQSIQTPSRRRVSVSSASHHGTSSSSIGSSSRVAAGTTTKKVNKPPRRNRAMSISFRLADFSFMMEGDDEEAGEKDKKDSIPALPQLDIQALQDVRTKAVEKRKMEERKRLAEMRKKKKKDKKEAALASDEKQDKDKKKVKKSKDAPGKKGKSQKEKERHIAKLTKGNLEKFDLQYQTKYPIRRGSLLGTEAERRRRLSTSFSIDSRNALSSDLYHTEKSSASAEKEVEKLPLVDQAPTESLTFDHMDSDYASSKAYRSRSSYRQISGAIVADRVAGRPWESFLKKQGKFYDLHHLQFWQTAQELLTLQGTKQGDETLSSTRQLVIQRITALYLLPSGKRHINLGDRLSFDLLTSLKQGRDSTDLLLHAQDLTSEVLAGCWKTFQKQDTDEFLMRTAYRKNFARSTFPRGSTLHAVDSVIDKDSQLSLVSFESSNHVLNMLKTARGKKDTRPEKDAGDRTTVAPHRMWKALELAQGTSNLVIDDGELSDPSDPEVDSDDEGSLRRPKITVYKERKLDKPLYARPKPQMETAIVPSRERRETTRTFPKAEESLSSISRTKDNKAICTAIRKNGKTIYRPPRPKTFQDVLRDSGHFEFFRRFLIRENSETPLQFWNAVEQMRTTCRDAKSRQNKTILIVRKFFGKATDYGAALQCDADVIQDIPTMEKVTPQMILSAQACVSRSMEERWFEAYRETFPEESIDGDIESVDNEIKLAPREKTKALWAMFINNVISFRRGLMNAASLKAFKDFLGKEVRREVEKQNQTGVQSKRMISNKVVVVEKILNDLSFWAEVERFKDLADNAARAAAAGTYTLEDEDYVQQKARSIIDCFLSSQVPPKVQINIPQEMADDILECADSGLIERGLFHDAALYVFTVLLYCWKRFCRERFSPPQDSDSESTSPVTKKKKRRKKRQSNTPTVCGVKIKTVTGTSVDDPPKLHFTLQHGLQLVLPPKPKQEDVQRQRLRQLLRQLYPNADESSIEYYLKQHIGEKGPQVGSQPQPQHQSTRRLSKALLSNTSAGSSGNLPINLMQRRMTRQFEYNKPLIMQKHDVSQNSKEALLET